MRLFVAIDLPPEVTDHLSRALEMVTPPERTARSPWIPTENWHITLAFYGEQPDGALDEIRGYLDQVGNANPDLKLSLAGAGIFHHDTCWIGVHDEEGVLAPLAKHARGDYSTPHQHAENRFHVTISRAGRKANLKSAMAALAVYRGPSWIAHSIYLYESVLGEGPSGHPRYICKKASPLLGPRHTP